MTSSTALTIRERTDAISTALDDRQEALAAFLPTRHHVERFKRVVLQSLAKNPDLLNASGSSIISSAFEAARLGLEPSGAIGGAHIVRYGQRAQLIVDYRGLVELARRSDEILSISSRIVREGEAFHVRYGSNAGIEHDLDLALAKAAVSAVYAIAKLRGGGEQFEVMTFDEIEAIRARSAAGNNGPWRTDWAEMAKKTVLRRLCKLLPLTVEAREALEREDEAERATAPVSAPPSGLRDAIAQRTAVLEQAVPNEEPEYQGEALDVDDIPFDAGQPAMTTDVQEASSAPAAPTDLDQLLAASGGTLVDDTAGGGGSPPAAASGADTPPGSAGSVGMATIAPSSIPTRDAHEAAAKAARRARGGA